jgi:hypothetical protein
MLGGLLLGGRYGAQGWEGGYGAQGWEGGYGAPPLHLRLISGLLFLLCRGWILEFILRSMQGRDSNARNLRIIWSG